MNKDRNCSNCIHSLAIENDSDKLNCYRIFQEVGYEVPGNADYLNVQKNAVCNLHLFKE